MSTPKIILTDKEITKIIERLAYEVLEKVENVHNIVIIGIQRRGVDIARRIKEILQEKTKISIPLGSLDINLYRDDWTRLEAAPFVNASNIPVSLEQREVILVDDVLFTGRTVRSALEALLDFGRPNKIKLLVLIDRGHRELPIHADFVGKTINTSLKETVSVLTKEQDGKDLVILEEKQC
ncbi:MAG: Bifunctional protein PyrR [Desulfonauticus sp. 38_4375]|nr:MAG: Bifunctional protein PyrR [Desulfonauticus sp. 38_4375]